MLAPALSAWALEQIPWVANLQQAQAMARAKNRLVLIHFWGDNCPPCDRMEQQVFNQPEVARAVGANYVPVKVNVHRTPELKNHFKITSWPTDLILTPDGKEIRRAIGFRKPDQYIALADGTAAAYRVNAGQPQGQIAASDTRDVISEQAVQQNQFQTVQYSQEGSPFRPGAAIGERPAFGDGSYASPPQVQPGARQPPPPAQPQVVQANPYVEGGRSVGASATADSRSGFQPSGAGGQFAAAAPAQAPATPPIAMDGYCPVSLAEAKDWRKGDRRFGAIHRGRTYLFAGEAEQQRFLENPDQYSPVLSGCDVVKFVEQGTFVDGQRRYGVFVGSHVFLFSDEASRDAFEKNPRHYALATWKALQDAGAMQR